MARLTLRIKLGLWKSLVVYTCFLLLLATGIYLYYWLTYAQNDPNLATTVLLKLHGVGAFISVFLFGFVSAVHAPLAWRRRRNRLLGAAVFLGLFLVVLSGVGLFYLPYEWHELNRDVHFWLSLFFVALFSGHIVRGKKTKR